MTRRAAARRAMIASLALVAAVHPACTRPASDRIDADLRVGHAVSAELRLDVVEGLAAVRRAEGGEIDLWAQAPAIALDVTRAPGAPADWLITVHNALADAVVTGAPAEPRETAVPTSRRFLVHLPSQGTTRLELAPRDAFAETELRFAVLSDVQEAVDRVQDVFARIASDGSIRFVVSCGDLADKGTRDELVRFQRELEKLPVPFYAAPGNHDVARSETDFRDLFGRGNLHFVYRGVAFTLLDSASATIDPVAYEWLDGWLAGAEGRVHVVGMHIPPLDPIGERNAAFASRAEAGKLISKLEAGRVDLALYGHIHSFYETTNGGIPTYISGGGGAHPERLGIGRHFLTVDVDARGVRRVDVVRVDGE